MTQIAINGSDSRTLHVLALDLPPEAVERFTTMAGTGEWPLKYALGAEKLREGFVDTVSIRDLGVMRLSQYITQAHDVSARDLGADKDRLDALKGHVIVLPAQAFDATSQTLSVAPPLTLVGSYGAAAAKARGPALQSAAAKGQPAGQPGGQRMGGLSRGVTLLLLGIGVLILLTLALIL